MIEIIGVGHSCYDMLCVVRDYPKEDGSTHILSIENQGGGAVATAMVAASILGSKTSFLGDVGFDEIGIKIRDEFKYYNVDISGLESKEDYQSLLSIVMINSKNGSRTKFPLLDQSIPIDWTKEKIELVRQSKVLHLDGTHFNNALKAAKIAKEGGVLISIDGCRVQEENELNINLASMADFLIMNNRYPFKVTGKHNIVEALLEIEAWGPKFVASTFGADGIYFCENGRVFHYNSYPIDAIDTTGAGDVFHGAFLNAFLRRNDIDYAIKFAAITAALKCRSIGGRKGVPTQEEVDKTLLSYKGFVRTEVL